MWDFFIEICFYNFDQKLFSYNNNTYKRLNINKNMSHMMQKYN